MKKHAKHRGSVRTLVLVSLLSFFVSAGNIWASTAPAKQTSCRVVIDSREVSLSSAPHVDEDKVYLNARDIFSVFGFRADWDSSSNVTTFISLRTFFTVDNKTNTVAVNGVKTAVDMRLVDERLYISADDLKSILQVSAEYSPASGILNLTTSLPGAVVRIDDSKLFSLAGAHSSANGSLYVEGWTLGQLLPGATVEVLSDRIVVREPDGSVTSFGFNCSIEYSPAGDSAPTKTTAKNLYRISGSTYLINIAFVSKYSGYSIVPTYGANSSLTIDVTTNLSHSVVPEAAFLSGKLSNVGKPSAVYAAPKTNANPSVRDTGYILDVAFQNELALAINKARSSAGLRPLVINHTTVYRNCPGTDPKRGNSFDNLRWCRENLADRKLEHLDVDFGMGEILMLGAKAGIPAAKYISLWENSPSHRYIMMHPDAFEVGVSVIQYPNGDVDVSAIFFVD